MTLKWNFWRGGGFNVKNLSWEGYGYFLEQHIPLRTFVPIATAHFSARHASQITGSEQTWHQASV